MAFSKRGMVQGDEKVDMLVKFEKKSKKRKKNAATDYLKLTKGDVKAVEHDSCFKEEKLATRKERDKAKMETKAPGEGEDSDIKRKKERGGGKQRGKSSQDGCEDAVTNVLKKKKKLKNEQETLIMHDASLDTKTIAHESASETQETKEVETLSEGSSGNLTDEVKRKKKKKDKREKEDGQVDIVVGVIQGDVSADEVKRKKRKKDKKKREDGQVDIVAGVIQDDVSAIDEMKRKKRKKDKRNKEDGLVDIVAGVIQGDVSAIDEMKRKERKKDKRNKEDGLVDIVAGVIQGDVSAIDEMKRKKRKKDKRNKEDGLIDIVAGVIQGDVSTIEEMEDRKIDDVNIRKRKKTKLGHNSKDLTSEKTKKRVRFSDHVQFFHPIGDPSNEKHENNKQKLLLGKKFTQEEDEIVKDAVHRYIELYNLGDEGLQKVLKCISYPELRGCWKEIGKAIPYRPYRAVYSRAQRLFRMGEKRKWTEEEYGMIRKFQGEHGNNWTVLADELGKHPIHVGNAWHRIKLENRKRGQWDQEEIQKFFDLVNTDLQLRLSEEKKSKHGMLRDNICWSSISDNLSTRISQHCCNKWYRQLTSPMVAAGEWADTDDYRLIDALFELDASCIEDVDWDNLLSHRHGDLCRKRWKQMLRQISQHESKSFAAQVEVLAMRYRPDLVGAREAWDSKPLVP